MRAGTSLTKNIKECGMFLTCNSPMHGYPTPAFEENCQRGKNHVYWQKPLKLSSHRNIPEL